MDPKCATFFHVTLLAHRILRWVRDFCKLCTPACNLILFLFDFYMELKCVNLTDVVDWDRFRRTRAVRGVVGLTKTGSVWGGGGVVLKLSNEQLRHCTLYQVVFGLPDEGKWGDWNTGIRHLWGR